MSSTGPGKAAHGKLFKLARPNPWLAAAPGSASVGSDESAADGRVQPVAGVGIAVPVDRDKKRALPRSSSPPDRAARRARAVTLPDPTLPPEPAPLPGRVRGPTAPSAQKLQAILPRPAATTRLPEWTIVPVKPALRASDPGDPPRLPAGRVSSRTTAGSGTQPVDEGFPPARAERGPPLAPSAATHRSHRFPAQAAPPIPANQAHPPPAGNLDRHPIPAAIRPPARELGPQVNAAGSYLPGHDSAPSLSGGPHTVGPVSAPALPGPPGVYGYYDAVPGARPAHNPAARRHQVRQAPGPVLLPAPAGPPVAYGYNNPVPAAAPHARGPAPRVLAAPHAAAAGSVYPPPPHPAPPVQHAQAPPLPAHPPHTRPPGFQHVAPLQNAPAQGLVAPRPALPTYHAHQSGGPVKVQGAQPVRVASGSANAAGQVPPALAVRVPTTKPTENLATAKVLEYRFPGCSGHRFNIHWRARQHVVDYHCVELATDKAKQFVVGHPPLLGPECTFPGCPGFRRSPKELREVQQHVVMTHCFGWLCMTADQFLAPCTL